MKIIRAVQALFLVFLQEKVAKSLFEPEKMGQKLLVKLLDILFIVILC